MSSSGHTWAECLLLVRWGYSPVSPAAAAKSLQSCPTLCDPIDGSPPSPSVPGILQVRTLEWVAISSSNAWKWNVKVKSLSRVQLFATSWTAAYQPPLSMGFSRQEYWSGVPLGPEFGKKQTSLVTQSRISLQCRRPEFKSSPGEEKNYSCLENSMDRLGGHKESHTTERLTLSLFFQHCKYLIQQKAIC